MLKWTEFIKNPFYHTDDSKNLFFALQQTYLPTCIKKPQQIYASTWNLNTCLATSTQGGGSRNQTGNLRILYQQVTVAFNVQFIYTNCRCGSGDL